MSSRLLFIVNDAGFFLSHRMPLALAAKQAGWEVHVACPASPEADQIGDQGFAFHPFSLERFKIGLFSEIKSICELRELIADLHPDLIHVVTLRASLPMLLVAWLCSRTPTLYAVTGGGRSLATIGVKGRLLRFSLRLLLSWLRRKPSYLLFQNSEDLRALASRPGKDVRLIEGSGVDPSTFDTAKEPGAERFVLLASRLIRQKGVETFAEAARLSKERGLGLRFLLAGKPEPGNPQSITLEELTAWQEEGDLEWLGHRSDIAALLKHVAIACLPSAYGEGVPKSLLEAAAAGTALIASDRPGCRAVVLPDQTGLLIEPGDPSALLEACERLSKDSSRLKQMGQAARALVEKRFSLDLINRQTLGLYEELVADRRSPR